jgi:nitrile hydratase
MHDHDHHPAIGVAEPPGYFEVLQVALEELLIERRILQCGEVERQIDVLDSRTPAKVIARAWINPGVRTRLLADGRRTCEELGVSFYDDTGLIVLENTERVHNLVVCTLCSCYPRPLLGLPPEWYKLKPYRARAVAEPRALLAEFGTTIPPEVEIRVADSTSALRFLVLPLRPAGTESYTEEQLADLVTRDAMIGVVTVNVDERRATT